ncbi:unnamed protein product [Ectocarpus sp. 12 AP-2014]
MALIEPGTASSGGPSPETSSLPRIGSRTFRIPDTSGESARDRVDLEEFKARLTEGFNLIKHSRSGKASNRVIYTVDNGVHFRMAKGKKGSLSKLSLGTQEFSLLSLAQVRMGTDKDPEHEDKTGSNPLRQGCPTEEDLRKGFSLVYLSRTLDFSCESEDEMHYIVNGFRAMVAETLAAGAGSSAFGSQSWVRKETR